MSSMNLGDEQLSSPLVTPDPGETPAGGGGLNNVLQRITEDRSLDTLVERVDRLAAPFGTEQARETLGGGFMGHNLHPALTDIPVGCWTSAMLLDLVGGRRSRIAARRLIGIGVLATVPTALAGLSDYTTIEDQGTKRVAAVHAAGNGVAGMAFLMSWRARRRGRNLRGMALSFSGGALAAGTAYLGGHLAFGMGVGSGQDRNGAGGDVLPTPDGVIVRERGPVTGSGEMTTDVMGSPTHPL